MPAPGTSKVSRPTRNAGTGAAGGTLGFRPRDRVPATDEAPRDVAAPVDVAVPVDVVAPPDLTAATDVAAAPAGVCPPDPL